MTKVKTVERKSFDLLFFLLVIAGAGFATQAEAAHASGQVSVPVLVFSTLVLFVALFPDGRR